MSLLVALQSGTHDVDITESVTASSSQIAVTIAVGVLTESLSATTAQTTTFTAIGLITESVTSGDSQAANYEANVTTTESLTANDSETGVSVVDRTLVEPVTVSETQIATLDAVASLTEVVAANESEAGTYTTDALASEAGTANESQVASAELVGLINESVVASESSVSVAEFSANLTETIEATESNNGQGAAQVFDVELAESLSVGESSVAFTISAPVSLPSIGGGYAPRRYAPRLRRPIPPPIMFNVTAGKVTESLHANDLQDANITVSNALSEGVSAESVAKPELLEVVKLDGVTLYLYDDLSISLDVEEGATVDVTVSHGKPDVIVELPNLRDLLS